MAAWLGVDDFPAFIRLAQGFDYPFLQFRLALEDGSQRYGQHSCFGSKICDVKLGAGHLLVVTEAKVQQTGLEAAGQPFCRGTANRSAA
jgi:hypothetical protein